MQIISYAQNREDVLLSRALSQVGQGFYIDVGANDPEKDSVTKTFYDRGWRGINVEPLPAVMKRLEQERPRDKNLRVLVGDNEATVDFFEIPEDDRLSTMDAQIARGHVKTLGYSMRKSQLRMTTLSRICEENRVEEVHFVKIDVEGHETEVLRGLDLHRWRPWILLIESTLPYSQVDASFSWEHLVTNAGYKCVFFDGLSKFFLAQEHGDLAEYFATPPNVFDGFVSSCEISLRKELEQLKKSPRLLCRALVNALRARLRRA